MMNRVFWGWERPVSEQATALLCKGFTGGELDLSDTLIIVPTAEAARRLREVLAKATAAHEGAAVLPHVWVPEHALLTEQDREQAPSHLASLFAWAQVLQRIDFSGHPCLFPEPPAERGWSWALATAEMLLDLGSALGAGGLNFTKLASHEASRSDQERWSELASLEQRYFAALKKQKLKDVQALKCDRAKDARLPEGVKRVLVLAAPDLPPLFSGWMESAAKQAELTVCIQAPEELRHAFDPEGRPCADFWQQPAALPAPIAVEHLHVAANAVKQADLVVGQIAKLALQDRTAVGVCDAEVNSALKERLAIEDVRVFDPAGVPPQAQGLWHVLICVRDLIASRTWKSLASLLRVEDVRAALSGGGEGSGSSLLQAADDFAQRHMPMTLEHALELLRPSDRPAEQKLKLVIKEALKLAEGFDRQPPGDAVRSLLVRLYGGHLFTPKSPADRGMLELAETVLETAQEVTREAKRFQLKPGGAEVFALVMDRAGTTMLTEMRGEVELVLQGWLELLWEQCPCLVVAGLNEEHVPGILVGHPFLPDSLRAALQLPSQDTRYARDAYLLHALAAQRRPGALQLICGQWGERGDALRPSRLLFRGPDKELPERVERLFPKDEGHAVATDPPRSLAWKLRPRMVSVDLPRVSASMLRNYLACPFRFYLRSGLHMQPVNTDKREMKANDFGDLIHVAVQKMAADRNIAASTKESDIADFLCAAAEDEARRLYGRRLTMLLRLQLESALQRLRSAAFHEAESRKEGWQIQCAELVVEGDLQIAGLPFRGKIDRIEQRECGGRAEIRLIDFKTSDKAQKPLAAHTREITGRSRCREEDAWKLFEAPDGRQRQWLDLQLPLYAAAMAARGVANVRVAYFNMPKNVQDVAITEWEDFDAKWSEQAVTFAEKIVQRIRTGVFWPPARVSFDDYEELFLGDIEGSVEFAAAQTQTA